MIKLTLFNPLTTPLAFVMSPDILPRERAYLRHGEGGFVFTVRDEAELVILMRRLVDAAKAAVDA